MSDVFKTITVTAANVVAARNLVTAALPSQGAVFTGTRTTVQGSAVPTHYLLSGYIPQEMASIFAPGGPGASITFDYSDEGWMAVCTRLGLYAVFEVV